MQITQAYVVRNGIPTALLPRSTGQNGKTEDLNLSDRNLKLFSRASNVSFYLYLKPFSGKGYSYKFFFT